MFIALFVVVAESSSVGDLDRDRDLAGDLEGGRDLDKRSSSSSECSVPLAEPGTQIGAT